MLVDVVRLELLLNDADKKWFVWQKIVHRAEKATILNGYGILLESKCMKTHKRRTTHMPHFFLRLFLRWRYPFVFPITNANQVERRKMLVHTQIKSILHHWTRTIRLYVSYAYKHVNKPFFLLFFLPAHFFTLFLPFLSFPLAAFSSIHSHFSHPNCISAMIITTSAPIPVNRTQCSFVDRNSWELYHKTEGYINTILLVVELILVLLLLLLLFVLTIQSNNFEAIFFCWTTFMPFFYSETSQWIWLAQQVICRKNLRLSRRLL